MTYHQKPLKAVALLLALTGYSSALHNPTLAFVGYGAQISTARPTGIPLHAYIPDGLTPEVYNHIKANDKKKLGSHLGKVGVQGFKSRSMRGWQEAKEKGKAGHVYAVPGFLEKLSKGLIQKSDIPYTQRKGGSWDNSDVKGAKKLGWRKTDKEYAKGGYKKEQSVSILGNGPGFDWTGTRPRDAPKKKGYPGFF